jgi:hypothetical protein
MLCDELVREKVRLLVSGAEEIWRLPGQGGAIGDGGGVSPTPCLDLLASELLGDTCFGPAFKIGPGGATS